MMDEDSFPLFGSRLKLSWAQEQLHRFTAETEAFLNDGAYTFELQVNESPEFVAQVIRIKKSCPPHWSVLIGDMVHNFRCVLDYLVFELVTKTEPKPSVKIQFPIFKTEDGFRTRGVPTMLRNVEPAAVALIKSLQPFATGEGEKSPLWLLSQLSNWDKHRAITVAGIASHRVGTKATVGDGAGGLLVFETGFIKDNTPVIGRLLLPGPESLDDRARKVKVDGDISLGIAFKVPQAVYGENVIGTMRRIAHRVFEVAEKIRAECFVGHGNTP